MRSGDARAHLTNSLSASLRLGGGFGMQNGLGPRNAAMFCISTKTAPCAKPSQKLTAAVPIALSGVASQSSTRSPVVFAPKFALCRGVRRKRHKKCQCRGGGPSLEHHGSPFPLYGIDIIEKHTRLPQAPYRVSESLTISNAVVLGPVSQDYA